MDPNNRDYDPNNNGPADQHLQQKPHNHDSPKHLLRKAVQNFDVTRVKDLLVPDPNLCLSKPYSRTPIHDLAGAFVSVQDRPADLKLKFIDILTLLTQNGVDINAVDGNRQSALHILSGGGSGQADVIKVLLTSGAKVNAQDRWGLNRSIICYIIQVLLRLLG